MWSIIQFSSTWLKNWQINQVGLECFQHGHEDDTHYFYLFILTECYNENVGQTVSCINTPQRADLERLSFISTPLFFLLQWKIQCISVFGCIIEY